MDYNVTDPIFERAMLTPAAPAIEDGSLTVDLGSLCGAAESVAHKVRRAGWGPEDVVGVSMPDAIFPRVAAALALARLGIAQVSLPPENGREARIATADRLGIGKLLALREADGLPGRACLAVDISATGGLAPSSPELRASGGDSTWIVIQTSGTTGQPKDIRVSHAMEQARAAREKALLACLPGERFLNFAGMQFWMGLSRALRCLGDGGTVVALPAAKSIAGAIDQIRRLEIGYVSCTPRHLHQLIEAPAERPQLPGLRVLRCSSASLPRSVLDAARTRLTPNIYFNYGTNEAGPLAIATPELLERFPDSVGRPVPGIELQVADGEVRVRGPGVLATSADGWSYPGDRAMLNEEGVLFLKGRSDEMMNCDGILVAPAEIEAVLMQHPAVRDAAAFSLASERHQDAPAAAVVLHEDVTVRELIEHCRSRLGARAPRMIVKMPAVPRNAMGKPLRSAIGKAVADQLRRKVTRS